ncbi:MAG: oligosaccharide flippase family protein [Mariniphaga sp.]
MKNTLKKIVREDNFLSLVGNLTISFFGIAGFALLARTFPMEIFGEWVIFISAAAFVEMFRYGIINTAIVRYLSGAEEDERIKFIGSNGLIGVIATFIICILLYICLYVFYSSIHNSGYELFFKWYPLLALINLPMNTALVIMQAELRFGKILLIRSIESVGFFIVVAVNYFFLHMSLMQLVISFLIIDAVASGVCLVMGWDGLKYIPKASRHTTNILLNFGKYTTFTLIGTNLLRSADTFIISFSPLGTAAVALYAIPMKLTELQQIPLRSFAATAFPKLSRASMQKNIKEVKEIFYTYSGAMTYLFIGISLVTFVFADLFILVLGGKQYLGTDPVTGFNAATIMRIFSIYGLLLPIDRMTGIGLDSINKPNINFLKVLYMVIANVIGDIIAIFIFKSLSMVAVASIFFTIIGIWVGFYYMNKELSLQYRLIFSYGIDFYKTIFSKLKKNLVR